MTSMGRKISHRDRIMLNVDDLRVRRDRLIDQIHTVFKDVKLGDGITLCEAGAIDSYGTDKELALAREMDQDIHWTQVDIEYADPGSSAMFFVDAAGFRFYLPAYLVYTLKHDFTQFFGGAPSELRSSNCIPSILNRSSTESSAISDGDGSPFGNFTRRECMCIARFLAFYAELQTNEYFDGAIEALKNHWGQYLSIQEMRNLQKIWPNRPS
tara:strand:- start:16164 stop:16799 length:636 start_codon:yes stop_codon:yes gene_type:complete